MTSKFLREYQLVLLGGGGVGKKSLAIRLVTDLFITGYDPTGSGILEKKSHKMLIRSFLRKVDCYRKQVMIDDEVGSIDVRDTAGQEEYSAIREQSMRTGEGFLLVYSITSRASFEKMSEIHHQLYGIKEKRPFPLVVVGNKDDLVGERVISVEEGEKMAKRFGGKYIETSAKTGHNVNVAFHDAVRAIRLHTAAQRPAAHGQSGSNQQKRRQQQARIKTKDGLKYFTSRCVVI